MEKWHNLLLVRTKTIPISRDYFIKNWVWYPQLESNQHLPLRRGLFYPLNYEDEKRRQVLYSKKPYKSNSNKADNTKYHQYDTRAFFIFDLFLQRTEMFFESCIFNGNMSLRFLQKKLRFFKFNDAYRVFCYFLSSSKFERKVLDHGIFLLYFTSQIKIYFFERAIMRYSRCLWCLKRFFFFCLCIGRILRNNNLCFFLFLRREIIDIIGMKIDNLPHFFTSYFSSFCVSIYATSRYSQKIGSFLTSVSIHKNNS